MRRSVDESVPGLASRGRVGGLALARVRARLIVAWLLADLARAACGRAAGLRVDGLRTWALRALVFDRFWA
ncbi:MAG: hypothetical protein OEM96_01895 [Gemmatimonadota bacterium]|nr:hypothetical protein [Gemmatimonadota bacterium]